MSNKIYIGNLDTRISIYKRLKIKSTTGQNILTNDLFLSVWSKKKDVSGSEEEEGKITLYAQRNYTIRYNDEIIQTGEEMFIQDVDGDFQIFAIEQIGRKNYIILKTVKRE